jgi:hypothetical protein
VKYRILALLDRLTGHRFYGVCNWVYGYELFQLSAEEREQWDNGYGDIHAA